MFKRLKRLKRGVKPTQTFKQEEEWRPPHENTNGQKNREVFSAERTVYLFPASTKKIGGQTWGYINAKGNFILPPIYEFADDFQENGLAAVQLNHLAGLINFNGYFIVNPQYDAIHRFSEGRAVVITPAGYKIIDESGKEVTSKEYSFISDYQEGRALFIDTDGKGNHLYGFLNRRGKEVLPPMYESASNFNGGKAVVKLNGGTYALINLTGRVLHTYPYAFVGNYSEGLLVFQKSSEEKFGYINEQGNIVIEPKFTEAEPFKKNRAIVRVNELYGLIDRIGQYILKPNYHNMLHLEEERIAIGKATDPEKPYIGSFYAVADTAGHILTGYIFNRISNYKDGKASAYDDQSTFFIDKNGNKIYELTIVSGIGHMHFDKKLIKAEVDRRLFYFNNKELPVWKQNEEIFLNEQFTVLEKKYKPNKDFLVYYPELNGMTDKKALAKINQALKDLSSIKETSPHLQLESNYTGDFNISFYEKDLVVIESFGYYHSFGAAHGLPVKKYAHIDLKMGRIFRLIEMFKPGSQYIKLISEIIADQIKNIQKYEYIFPGSYKGIQEDQPFFISKGHLNLYFYPYEIAPYTAGFPTFAIPFEKLMMIIDQKSDFWKSFN